MAPFARATGSATQPPDASGSLPAKDVPMRDFRDAKAMAQTLRQSLTQKSVSISHSESLELVSKMLGAADWNTLSALIQAGRPERAAAAAASRPCRAAIPPFRCAISCRFRTESTRCSPDGRRRCARSIKPPRGSAKSSLQSRRMPRSMSPIRTTFAKSASWRGFCYSARSSTAHRRCWSKCCAG